MRAPTAPRSAWTARLTGLAVILALFVPSAASAAPTWLPQNSVTPPGANISDPASAMDSAGDVITVWEASDGSGLRIQAGLRPAGGAFTDLGFISDAGFAINDPAVAMDAAGDAMAVWIQSDGSHYRVKAAFRPAGGAFGAAQTLSDPGQSAALPVVAMNPQGDSVVAWERPDASTSVVIQATVRPAGGSFGPAPALSDDGKDAEDPSAAISSNGDVIVGWDRPNSSNVKIAHASVMPAGGSFPASSQVLSDGVQGAIGVKVAMDGGGNAFAVWSEPVTGPSVVMERMQPAGGTFSSSTVQNLSDQTVDSFASGLKMNAQGQAVLAETFVDGVHNRVAASLRPAGGAFGSFQVLSPPGANGQAPAAAVDPKGNAIVGWEEGDSGHVNIAASTAPAGGAFAPFQTISIAGPGEEGVNTTVGMDALGDGEATFSWRDGSDFRGTLAGYDAAGPTLSGFGVPGTGVTGTPLSFGVTATDVWSAVAPPSWNFGDGASLAGDPVTHTYTTPGSHAVSVTATDAVGNSSTATGQVTLAAGKPSISKLRISPTSFAAASHGGSVAKRRKTGATVSYTDTLPAKTTFTVKKSVGGVRKGKKCVARKRGQKGGRSCKRLKSLGSFRRTDKPGANHFVFTGRVHRHKLRRGSYKLAAAPKTSGGSGKTVSRSFKIKG